MQMPGWCLRSLSRGAMADGVSVGGDGEKIFKFGSMFEKSQQRGPLERDKRKGELKPS